MKKSLIKILSVILIFTLTTVMTPLFASTSYAAESDAPDIYTLSNGYVTVTVSGKNGGFDVETAEGNKLIKSDNNKRLLYHSGEYDTSFTSFEVTYIDDGNKVKEYIFGGNYSFLGLSGNNLTTTQDAAGITSTWTVDELTFTQRIQLANVGANEHGMVIISYKVESARTDAVSVRERLLLDTALGAQDYAVYEIMDENNNMRRVEAERIFETNDYIPLAFFGYDDPNAPAITAYTVNNATTVPYMVAFAHWNNLAATAFDFVPDSSMTFTNKNNIKYQTADSAYALYYDMGTVPANGAGKTISTNYGVYSNSKAEEAGKIALNVVSPTSLELSSDKKTYLKTDSSVPGDATFGIQAQIENFTSDDPNNVPKDYERVTVVFYPANGITPVDNSGKELSPAPSYYNPFTVDINNFKAGMIQTASFYFKADAGDQTAYRKVEMRIFDTSSDKLNGGNGLVQENLIASHSFYVLCPGGEGSLPKITFTGEKPEILYYKGIRHIYITGGNLDLLENKALYELWVYNTANADIKYKIDPGNILFEQKNGIKSIDAILTAEMVPGSYQLKFELTPDFAQTLGCSETITAPALSLVISDDGQYKFVYYGVLAVVQSGTDVNAKYYIKSYKNEDEFNNDKANYQEVLVTLRGDFTRDDDGHGDYIYKAMSGKKGFNNVIINNSIDFQEGVVSVYYHYGSNNEAESVYVDLDGSLYTAVEGTSIWKGKAALTEIKNGEEYGLIPYNSHGERLADFTAKTITLIWPDIYGLYQTLSGMIFKLTYGVLGRMYETNAKKVQDIKPTDLVLGDTVAFSAYLDLGFLIPKSQKAKDAEGRGVNVGTELYWITENPSGELRGLWNHYYNETKKKKSQTGKEFTKGQASVMVDDILFGCGEGFIGVNFKVGLALPAYVDSMPSIDGTLCVNTIGDWSFGVSGKCQFTTMTLEADLAIKSYNNIPIPDKLYLYLEGFEPGVNVDGLGVFWITGGGGGFDDLYNTIFLTDSIPPLKLLLSMSFDIVKVMSARADLSLSLRGIGLSVSNVKLKMTDIVVLSRLRMQFDWYPDIYLMASLDANLYFGTIRGQGYLVAIENDNYPNGFFEGFIRGTLMIPSEFPFIGGMEVGRVDFGLSSTRVWGAAKVLSAIGVSVVYYWGGDVSISTGSKTAYQPTFPELLGCEDIPIYYDKETARTLYMHVGDNLTLAAANTTGNFTLSLSSSSPLNSGLLAGSTVPPSVPAVKSDADLIRHIVFVPDEDPYNKKKYLYTASFTVPKVEAGTDEEDEKASLAKAKTVVAGFTIRNKNDPSEEFPLEIYEALRDADGNLISDNMDTANANVTYDMATEKAVLAVTLTKTGDFGKEWEILTPDYPADIVLFEVGELPGISSVSIDSFDSGAGILNASWSGTELNTLEKVSFSLTKDQSGEDIGEPIATLTTTVDITQDADNKTGSGTFTIPPDLPSGNYYLRAVYSKEGSVNGVVMSSDYIVYNNVNQPIDPSSVIIANGGDLTFDVTLAGNIDKTDADGYLANVYEVNDQGGLDPTDISNMTFDRDDEGNLPPIAIGGSYQTTGSDGKPVKDSNGKPVTHGLTGGNTYVVGITAYKYVYDDKDGDGQTDDTVYGIVFGNEVLSGPVQLLPPSPPNITISAAVPFVTVTTGAWQQRLDENGDTVLDADGNPIVIRTFVNDDVFKTADVSFDVISDVNISGIWYVDNFELEGDFTDTDGFNIALTGLSDGKHTLEIAGADADGDGFRREKVFTVDTQAPNLLLSAPINGSLFGEDGKLNIKGISDKDALFTIEIDGEERAGWVSKTINQMGGTINDSGVFDMEISVDPGVSKHQLVIKAADAVGNTSSASADVQNTGLSNIESLSLLADGIEYTNRNLIIDPSGSTNAIMALNAKTAGGSSFVINDSALINWTADTVNGSAVISDDGMLTVSPGSLGFVTGELKVAESASMTASATFGAEIYSKGPEEYAYSTITVGKTVGGNVSGGGRYVEGLNVWIKAVPDPGYRFTGWTVQGNVAVTVANRFSAQTTIIIPADDATIIANFEYVYSDGTDTDTDTDTETSNGEYEEEEKEDEEEEEEEEDGGTGEDEDNEEGAGEGEEGAEEEKEKETEDKEEEYTDKGPLPAVTAASGDKVSIPLPKGMNGNNITVYFIEAGVEHIVSWSTVSDGNLTFIAPGDGKFYFKEIDSIFTDIKDHWARENIEFAYIHDLFKGIGNDLFGPDMKMTRSMFVTVLGRLHGIDPSAYNKSSFNDVEADTWYSSYVQWASKNKIVLGVGNGNFEPDREITRQEMCVIFERYIKYAGLKLENITEDVAFLDEDKISNWAVDAVEFCRKTGLMKGDNKHCFNPLSLATRAEVATVFKRLIEKVLESL